MTAFPPPAGLSDRSAALFAEIVPKRARSAGRVALVTEALRALDRADEAAAIVSSEGMTFTTEGTKTVHVRPEVKIERESRMLFLRAWGQLHLEWDADIDGRHHWPEDEEEPGA